MRREVNLAIRVICGAYLAFSAITAILALASYFNIDWRPFRKGKTR